MRVAIVIRSAATVRSAGAVSRFWSRLVSRHPIQRVPPFAANDPLVGAFNLGKLRDSLQAALRVLRRSISNSL